MPYFGLLMSPRDASRHVVAKLFIPAETPYRLLDFSIALLGTISLDDRIIVCGVYFCEYVRWHIHSVFETGPTNNNCLYETVPLELSLVRLIRPPQEILAKWDFRIWRYISLR